MAGYHIVYELSLIHILALAQGIETMDNIRDTLNVESILTTSDSAYSKTDLENMQTMEKEDGDIDGPFDLGVYITEDIDDEKQTQIVYYGTETIFDDTMNASVSGTNYELLSASLSWMCQSEEDGSTEMCIRDRLWVPGFLCLPGMIF